jgi:hypothetical protein
MAASSDQSPAPSKAKPTAHCGEDEPVPEAAVVDPEALAATVRDGGDEHRRGDEERRHRRDQPEGEERTADALSCTSGDRSEPPDDDLDHEQTDFQLGSRPRRFTRVNRRPR